MQFIEPLLCTECHNTEEFHVRAEVDVHLMLKADSTNDMAISEPEFTPHSTIACAPCCDEGTGEWINFPGMIAPAVTVFHLNTPVRDIGLVPEDDGYSIQTGLIEGGQRLAGPLYYAPGLKGTVETPDASNVTESVTNWMVGVIRDSGLPLLENRETTKSEYALHLEGLHNGEKELILARCKAEGIGGY